MEQSVSFAPVQMGPHQGPLDQQFQEPPRQTYEVIAERRDPYIFMDDGPHRALVGDRYVSTYTYGPLGLIMRTAEMSDADPTNNRNHYYLPDVMGGNIGLYVDDDGDPATDPDI